MRSADRFVIQPRKERYSYDELPFCSLTDTISFIKKEEELPLNSSEQNIETFDDVKNEYYSIKNKIDEIDSQLNGGEYESCCETVSCMYNDNKLMATKMIFDYNFRQKASEEPISLSFQEIINLYTLTQILLNDGKYDEYNKCGIDLLDIEEDLLNSYESLRIYLQLQNDKDKLYSELGKVVEKISFGVFTRDGHHHECCKYNHFLMKIDGELKCIWCNGSTNDYELTKEDVDFLTEIASEKNILFKDAIKEDLPLIQVLKEEAEVTLEAMNPDNFEESDEIDTDATINDDELDSWEMYNLWCEEQYVNISRNVMFAHMLDNKEYSDGQGYQRFNPQYLSPKKVIELWDQVKEDEKNVESEVEDSFDWRRKPRHNPSDYEVWCEERKTQLLASRRLMTEMLQTRKYEIIILSGEHIPTFYKELKSDWERTCFAKAYARLMNIRYRKESGYFAGEDAYFYECLTADPEINKKVFELKSRKEETK